MGSPDGEGDSSERPQHQVTIQSFLLGRYPVTQAQWRAVAALPKIQLDLNPDPSTFRGERRPVEKISWHEAVEFCQRLSKATGRNYRLPSETEWEYACRAGTTTPFHFGATLSREVCNCKRNLGMALVGLFAGETSDVGYFKVANAFGLYDMHGNIWEWCADHWHENYQGAPIDGSTWITGGDGDRRLLRGGSWYNDPWYCRSADRHGYVADCRNLNFGFRLALSLPGL